MEKVIPKNIKSSLVKKINTLLLDSSKKDEIKSFQFNYLIKTFSAVSHFGLSLPLANLLENEIDKMTEEPSQDIIKKIVNLVHGIANDEKNGDPYDKLYKKFDSLLRKGDACLKLQVP